jgi:hypothetical protein
MALFFECMPQCAQKVFDTADIVRDRDVTSGGSLGRIVEEELITVWVIDH